MFIETLEIFNDHRQSVGFHVMDFSYLLWLSLQGHHLPVDHFYPNASLSSWRYRGSEREVISLGHTPGEERTQTQDSWLQGLLGKHLQWLHNIPKRFCGGGGGDPPTRVFFPYMVGHLEINSQKWRYWNKGTSRHFYGLEKYYQNAFQKGWLVCVATWAHAYVAAATPALGKPSAGKSSGVRIREPQEILGICGTHRPARS